MAKNFNNDNFNGSIGDKTYYKLKGVGKVVRKKSGPSKQDFLNNPNFEKTRQNNKELGGASVVAKAIRLGLDPIGKEFQDSTLSGRLSGAIRHSIAAEQNTTSPRNCNIKKHYAKIQNFQLSKLINFNHIYSENNIITINDARTIITMKVNSTAKHNHIKPPKSASHFTFTIALSLVSNHHYNPASERYEPTNPQQNAIGTNVNSMYYKITETYNNEVFEIHIPNNQTLAQDVTATLWLGITYYILEGAKFYDLPSQKAMKCIATF
uniref:hypothetical protein n=1 Tax=Gelidibacter sp. TaxID=2018083 RepID=UPI004049DBBB